MTNTDNRMLHHIIMNCSHLHALLARCRIGIHLLQGTRFVSTDVSASQRLFSRERLGTFLQQSPSLENTYVGDYFLRSWLCKNLPQEVLSSIEPDLINFGRRVATDIYDLGRECELNQPYLRSFNAWGKRVDEIVTCTAWKELKKISAEEGLVSLAYDRQFGEWSRVYQQVKLFLAHPSYGLYTCPLAMTDGAAKTIQELNLTQLSKAYKHLTTRNPSEFWTSGQWMTEKKGGSDVGDGTETLAVPQKDGTYRLYGFKWFSSATDSDVALALARVVDNDGNCVEGSKGTSMFYLELRDNNGQLNDIEVIRLKDKLGTRQLPTAELLLDGTRAELVSPIGRGVASITEMLKITRIHTANACISTMRRILALGRQYSTLRTAFKNVVKCHPLHMRTMAEMEIETRGCTALILECCRLLGLEDARVNDDRDSLLLRLVVPVTKLYSAKVCVPHTSEGLELFGGQGYMEDTGMPGLLRDVQVNPIWEGTTNILSLDVLRAVAKTNGEVLVAWKNYITEKLNQNSQGAELNNANSTIQLAMNNTLQIIQDHPHLIERAARDFAFSLARITAATLLVDQAAWSGASTSDVYAALKWVERDLSPVSTNFSRGHYDDREFDKNTDLVFEGFSEDNILQIIH